MEDQSDDTMESLDAHTESKTPDQPPEKGEETEAGSSQSLLMPLTPNLKTDKEKAAWEKYKDQFKSLCEALNKEGVEVLVFSKSKDGTDVCGTDGGLNFLKKQPELEESFAEHCDGSGVSQVQDEASLTQSNNATDTTKKRGRGRPPKPKSGSEDIVTLLTRKKDRSLKTTKNVGEENIKSPDNTLGSRKGHDSTTGSKNGPDNNSGSKKGPDNTSGSKKGPGRPRKNNDSFDKLPMVQTATSKDDTGTERRRSSRFSIKEEPVDDGYPDDRKRRKNKLVCENCDVEFMLECLLERHLNFCKKRIKTPVKDQKKRKRESEETEQEERVLNKKDIEKEDDFDQIEEDDTTLIEEDFESEDEDWNPKEKSPKSKKREPVIGHRKRGRPPIVKKEKPDKADTSEVVGKHSDEALLQDSILTDVRVKKELKGSAKMIVEKELLDLKPDGLVCQVCNKEFKDNKYLIRHMVVHTGEREFSCRLCSKTFTRKYDLHIHMIRVHSWVKSGRGIVKDESELEEGEIIIGVSSTKKAKTTDEKKETRVEKCDFCQEEFQQLKELEAHLQETHGDVEKSYKCLECEINFAMHFQLKNHHQTLHGEKVYVCDICNKGFDLKAGLNAHIKTHTDTKSYLCDFCGKGFTLQKYLAKHKQRHLIEGKNDQEKSYVCTICNTVFEHLPEFQGHMKSHKEEELRIFHCDQCPKGFFKLAHLKRHLLTHASQRAFKCEECGKTYKDPDTLRKHQKFIHSLGPMGLPERKPMPCDQCDKVFFNSGHLKRHKFRHTGQKPFPCEACGKCFAEKKSLESHVRIHTGERPYECKDCNRRFVQVAHLNRHRFLHTGIRAFQCAECKKKFFERSDLKKHMRIHDKIKPFKCDICNMSFAQKNVLVCHRRRHTGERPYVCDICSRGFTQLGSLQTHRRLHTGERPYKCSQCTEGFVSKERLKFHQFVHTGISPHICHICGKGFRLKFKLQSHIDSHEGVFRHKCNYCAKGFLEKSKLKRHLRQVHNEDGPRISYQTFTRNVTQEDDFEDDVDDSLKPEIIIRNLGQYDMKDGEAEEVIEYVTIPGNLTEADDIEATNAVSHITLETAGSNLATLMDGSNITIPQDSIIYQEGNQGEEVVYVVIPEENQTVILS